MTRLEKRICDLEARRPRKRGKGHWLVKLPEQSSEDALAAYGPVAEGDSVLMWAAAV